MMGTTAELAISWVSRLIDVVVETERSLPKKHLLAQQLETKLGFSADPRTDVIVAQYINHNGWTEIGGIEALDVKYDLAKPIELNETGYYPSWYNGDMLSASRVEAWEFIVGGGAGFNQLNGCYTVKDPGGRTQDNFELLNALRNLKTFMHSFSFEKMYQQPIREGYRFSGCEYQPQKHQRAWRTIRAVSASRCADR